MCERTASTAFVPSSRRKPGSMPSFRRANSRVLGNSAWAPTFVGVTVLQLSEEIARRLRTGMRMQLPSISDLPTPALPGAWAAAGGWTCSLAASARQSPSTPASTAGRPTNHPRGSCSSICRLPTNPCSARSTTANGHRPGSLRACFRQLSGTLWRSLSVLFQDGPPST